MRGTALVLTCALTLAGCASTSYAPEADSGAAARFAAEVHGDVPRLNFAKQNQLTLPAKLAVADVRDGTPEGPGPRVSQLVRVLSEDGETYEDVVSLASALSGSTPTGNQLVESLREHASRHHADLLVIAERNERVIEETNALAFLNILILPLLFVPTQSNDLDVSLHATVYDVRNGLAYTTFDSHKSAHVNASSLAEDGAVRDALTELYAQCTEDLARRLGPKLRGVEKQSVLARGRGPRDNTRLSCRARTSC